MAAQSIGVRIALEGAGDYVRDLKTVIQETKTLKTELDLASRIKNPFERSSSMKSILTSEIAAQEEKVRMLTDAYYKAEDATGKFSQKTLKARDALDKAEIALDSMKKQLKELPNGFEMAGDDIIKASEKVSSFGADATAIGRTMMPVTGAVAGVFSGGIKAAIDWESAYNGVMKTIDASESEYEALKGWIMDYSRTVGVSKSEIASTMQLVGQLGVSGVENIQEFTRTAIEMGEATDWSAGEAADSMARFMNVFSTPKDRVKDLGNVIVALGNNLATTEPEIGEMAQRLASASAIAGLTEEQVLALAASMSAVGINAEAGGSAMSKVISTIGKAVEAAGTQFDTTGQYADQLELLAKIAGMTGDEFKKAWGTDTIGTLMTFIEHLDDAERTGSSALLTLDDLGMSEIRVSNALRSLTLASDEVYRAQQIANQEVSNGSALTNEASVRWGEYSHRIAAAKEGIINVGISIGQRLLPYVERGIDFVQRMVDKWDALSPAMKDTIIKTAALTAAVSPLMLAIGGVFRVIGSVMSIGGHLVKGAGKVIHLISGAGGMLSSLTALKGGMDTTTTAAGILSGAKGIGSIIAAAGPYVAATGLIIGAGVLVAKNWDEIKEAAKVLGERIKEKWKNIKEWTSQTWDSLKETVSKGWNNINDLTGGALKNIGDKVSETVRNAPKWGKDFISNLGNGIKNGIEWVGNTAKSVGQRIKDFLGHSTPKEGPLADDDKWMPDMMQNFVSGIRNGIPGIENNVRDIGYMIKNGMLNGVHDTPGEMAMAMNAAALSIKNAESHFKSAAATISNSLTPAFKQMAVTAKTWGTDLMQNLAAGITNSISRVRNAAQSVAQTVKNYLGFSEPDKGPLSDFHTYMPDMMKLMAQGIKDGIPMIRDAVNSTAYALLPQAPYVDLPAAGNSYQTNMGGVTIQIYAQPGQDVDDLAEAIEERLVAMEERRMYAYG